MDFCLNWLTHFTSWNTLFYTPGQDQCNLCISKIINGDYYCRCEDSHRFHIVCFLKYCYQNNILPPNQKRIPLNICPICNSYKLKKD